MPGYYPGDGGGSSNYATCMTFDIHRMSGGYEGHTVTADGREREGEGDGEHISASLN